MPSYEHEKYVKNLWAEKRQQDAQSGVVEITDIVENEDGSADITFEVPPDIMKKFAEKGFQYTLVEAMFDNITLEEVIKALENSRKKG
jgi:hypothetical protein